MTRPKDTLVVDFISSLIIIFIFFIVLRELILTIFLLSVYTLKYLPKLMSRKKLTDLFKVAFLFWIVILFFFDGMFTSPGHSIMFMIALPLMWFIISAYMPKEEHTKIAETLTEKIKQDLDISYVSSKQVAFPKPLSWIGGFVTPLYPFFSVVNKNWKKKMNPEVIIHEHMHLNLLLNGGYLLYAIIGILMISLIAGIFTLIFSEIIGRLVLSSLVALMLVLFERKTFKLTYEYGKQLNIETRQWNGKIALNYFTIYFLWALVVSLIGLLFREGGKWLA